MSTATHHHWTEFIQEGEQGKSYRHVMFTQNVDRGALQQPYTVDYAIERLRSHKTVKRWGVILHDQDGGADHTQGMASSDAPLTLEKWREWLDIPASVKPVRAPNNIKGSAVMESVGYLTHEFVAPGEHKHVYSRSEVTVSDGWDWSRELDEYWAEKRRRAMSSTNRRGNSLSEQVRVKGLSLHDAKRKGAVNGSSMERNRAEYLRGIDMMNTVRQNIYVHGEDAVATRLLARGVAQNIANGHADNPRFFEFQDTFDGYDGEPVLLIHVDKLARIDWDTKSSPARAWGDRDALTSALDLVAGRSIVPIKAHPNGTQLVHRSVVLWGDETFFKKIRVRTVHDKAVWTDRLVRTDDMDESEAAAVDAWSALPQLGWSMNPEGDFERAKMCTRPVDGMYVFSAFLGTRHEAYFSPQSDSKEFRRLANDSPEVTATKAAIDSGEAQWVSTLDDGYRVVVDDWYDLFSGSTRVRLGWAEYRNVGAALTLGHKTRLGRSEQVSSFALVAAIRENYVFLNASNFFLTGQGSMYEYVELAKMRFSLVEARKDVQLIEPSILRDQTYAEIEQLQVEPVLTAHAEMMAQHAELTGEVVEGTLTSEDVLAKYATIGELVTSSEEPA